MSQKSFIGTVILWSWPILAMSEQNTIISFSSVWLEDRMRVRSQLYKSSTGVLVFIFSSECLCVFQHLWLPKDGRDRLKESPVCIQDTWIINCSMLLMLLKHWASFLNKLNLFPTPFMHDLLPGPGLAQDSGDSSTAAQADPAAGGGRKA